MKELTTNHNTQIDNGVRHNFAYVSGPFLCGGGFLFLFKSSKVHHFNAKWLQDQSFHVLPDL